MFSLIDSDLHKVARGYPIFKFKLKLRIFAFYFPIQRDSVDTDATLCVDRLIWD